MCGEQVLEVQHEEVKGTLMAAQASKKSVLRKLERQSSSFEESLKVTLHGAPPNDPCTKLHVLCLKYDLDAFLASHMQF